MEMFVIIMFRQNKCDLIDLKKEITVLNGRMSPLCTAGWLLRSKLSRESSRTIQVTQKGWAGLKAQLGVKERSVALVAVLSGTDLRIS